MQQIDDFYAVEFVGEPYYQFAFQVEDLLKILRVWSGYLDPILESMGSGLRYCINLEMQ